MNKFFQKQEEHLITYKSGNTRTTIDYILVKRTDLKAAKDCKVIPGESIAMQHRILVMDYRQIRWWNLKKEKPRAEYQASVTIKLDEIGLDLDWNKIKEILISTAKEKLGQTSGKGAYNEKESLWWNEDTPRATTAKEKAFKAYQKDKSEEQHCAYKEANKTAKRAVAMAKEEAVEELYTQLDTREESYFSTQCSFHAQRPNNLNVVGGLVSTLVARRHHSTTLLIVCLKHRVDQLGLWLN